MKLATEMCELSKTAEENRKKEMRRQLRDYIRSQARYGNSYTCISLTDKSYHCQDGYAHSFGMSMTKEYILELKSEGFKLEFTEVHNKIVREKDPFKYFGSCGRTQERLIPGYSYVKISWCCDKNS